MIAELLNALAQDRGPAADIDVDLTSDQVFDVLGNQRRRDILRYLAAHGGCDADTVDLDELVMYIATVEYGLRVNELSHEHEWTACAALTQTHLPLLEEVGLLTYDADAERIEPSDDIDDVAALLTIIAHASTGGGEP